MPQSNAGQPDDRGILLVNLGSPDSTSVADVRRYLNEFLMDSRVLDTPWPLRRAIVSLTILPKRPIEAAEAYRSIWTDEGSPLVVTSRHVTELLREKVEAPVALAMRYGSPSIRSGLEELLKNPERPVREIFLVPLYAHFAMSSFETVVVEAERQLRKLGNPVPMTVMAPFYKDARYIHALAEATRPHLDWDYDHLLFSFHGLPERHLRKADPTGAHCLASADCCTTPSPAHETCYKAQCLRTTSELVKALGVPADKYSISFQSRLGRDPWLRPYTDFEFKRLAEGGVRKLLVICPAFVSDCLETLEEIGIRGVEEFKSAGGEDLRLIPCMNEHPTWIDTLKSFCAD